MVRPLCIKNAADDFTVESNDDIKEEEYFDDILDCERSEQEVRKLIMHLKAGTYCILAEILTVAELSLTEEEYI